jgi:hypothetical protein
MFDRLPPLDLRRLLARLGHADQALKTVRRHIVAAAPKSYGLLVDLCIFMGSMDSAWRRAGAGKTWEMD